MSTPTAVQSGPRLLADHHFNDDIVDGVLRDMPTADIVKARQLGLQTLSDPALLAHAKTLDRIILTHDKNTMRGFFYAFLAEVVAAGEHSPGIIFVGQDAPVGRAIEDLETVLGASTHEEYQDRELHLPFPR